MLTWYFLRSFFYHCSFYFLLLTGIFASCNIFIRLPVISSFFAIPKLVLAMLPLMALFSLPISAGLAVYITIIQHDFNNELLILSCIKNAQRALHKAVLLFSLCCYSLYIIFVFQLAPQSYRLGKQLLFRVAKEHFLQLEPNKFHTPFAGCTFFFKQKKWDKKNPIFSILFLAFTNKNNEHYFFTADQGFFFNNILLLEHGAVHSLQNSHYHSATFQYMHIDLNAYIDKNQAIDGFNNFKYATLNKLLFKYKKDAEIFIELHKRLAQTLWQFILPILALFIVYIFHQKSLLIGFITIGSLYLISYILLALGQSYCQYPMLALVIFYIPIVILLSSGYYFYRRKRYYT